MGIKYLFLFSILFVLIISNLADKKSKILQLINQNYSSKFKSFSKRDTSDTRSRYGTGFELIKHDLIYGLEKIQSKMSDKDLECMPGSVFYNGTCIFISSKHQKLSWLHSERFCRRLPLNTTFLIMENNHKYEFLKREIIKLREKENPVDQLTFYIGFRYLKSEWKWVNNKTITNTNLTLGRYWWDWSGSHGDCGSLALLKNNDLIMRSAPCLSTSARFICEYNLNPCFKNDICGPHGRCVNLYYRFYCDCSESLFYEGKYCEKYNSGGIQVIVGFVIIVILLIGLVCNSSKVNTFWHKHCGKDEIQKELNLENEDENQNENEANPNVEYASDEPKSPLDYKSLSIKLKNRFRRIIDVINADLLSYCFSALVTLSLVCLQIAFSHNIYEHEFIKNLKVSKPVVNVCGFIETYYLFEDLIYLPFSLFFLIILYIRLRPRRFNKYIMIKFKNYFQTDLFKKIQEQNRLKHMEIVRKKEKLLKQKRCGICRFVSYKCATNKCTSVFCCLFCCSCCVPPGSNTRCFLWYCCCLGWRQTDFYKFLKTIRDALKCFFNIILCCPLWKCLLRLTQKKREERIRAEKERKKEEKKRKKEEEAESNRQNDVEKGSDTTSIDQDSDFDEDDYDISTQAIKGTRSPCPFPSTPFSTSNRALSAAVYVFYTYDILNIFMYVFTANLATSHMNIPFIGKIGKGVILDLIIQVLHVIMIGIKLYPILVVADADPSLIVYFTATIYMFFIWLSWFLKKALCSRREAFIGQIVKNFASDLKDRVKYSFNLKRNITDTVFGLFTDEDRPSEKYSNALKEKIPNVFREFFGKYNPNDKNTLTNEEMLVYNSFNDVSENKNDLISTLNNYYSTDYPIQVTYPITTSTLSTQTSSFRFRDLAKNKTLEQFKVMKDFYFQRDQGFVNLINIFENLPLYLTLSYLLVRYGILFVSCLENNIRQRISKTRQTSNIEEKGELNIYDRMLSNLDEGYTEKNLITERILHKDNHNYMYIKNLLNDSNLFDSKKETNSRSRSLKQRIEVSYIWSLFEKYVYKKVPYLKFSKQYVNTYIVAFMVIYFFTLFGLRLSNIFGNALVGTIEFIYTRLFRGLIPSIDLEEHNFNAEFRTCCILTSLVSLFHLFSSIKTFQRDIIRLHKGEKFFRSLVLRYKDEEYTKIIRKRNKESSTITSDSLHFPGYLVAHLVYGYVLIFIVFFILIIIAKLFFYSKGAFQVSLRLLFPIIILFLFKFMFNEYLIKVVFLKNDTQRITNIAPYYVISYFNFFFDCFLGLIACVSRVWQTTVISLIRLPRLDISMFNKDDDLIMKRLDKGHLAYLNHVRMEHWYNNPVLNGFCEMLIESMLYSQIYRAKYETIAGLRFTQNRNSELIEYKLERSISKSNKLNKTTSVVQQIVTVIPPPTKRALSHNVTTIEPRRVYFEQNDEQSDDEDMSSIYDTLYEKSHDIRPSIIRNFVLDPSTNQEDIQNENNTEIHKKENDSFEYKSFLRLRNMIFLCLLLRKNPSLMKYRKHYLEAIRKKQIKSNTESAGNFLKRYKKFFEKYLIAKSSTRSKSDINTSTTNTHNDNDNDNDSNADNNENRMFVPQRNRRYSS